jgi:hypothetical protein
MGPIGCPETSLTNYRSSQCNIPEELRSHNAAAEVLNHSDVLNSKK